MESGKGGEKRREGMGKRWKLKGEGIMWIKEREWNEEIGKGNTE